MVSVADASNSSTDYVDLPYHNESNAGVTWNKNMLVDNHHGALTVIGNAEKQLTKKNPVIIRAEFSYI